ncbi:putative zinc finger protein [Raphanus sativus]|nr:putative zinc finger protein [Raphanus sativus]
MEQHLQYPYQNPFERRPILKSSKAPPAVRWIKDWVPQDIVATGAKCYLRKWVTEETLKTLKEKEIEPTTTTADGSDPDSEPTSEILFLCSYDGCGKIFFDVNALRKHSHVHGERQYVCDYPGCDKKFLDSSKLKRHWLIHTGARDFVCTYEGCGKAFSLDFNLRSHMKTHSQANYHICPYSGCGKRYAHEYKLKNHLSAYHEKNAAGETPTYTPPAEKVSRTPKTPAATVYASASLERPYTCPYEGCDKAYIHEYKLKLHLKREHLPEENSKTPNLEEGSDQDVYRKHAAGNGKSQRHKQQSRAKPKMKTTPPPAKAVKKGSTSSPGKARMAKKPWRAIPSIM